MTFDYSRLDLQYGLKYKVTRKSTAFLVKIEKPNYDIHNHCIRCRKNYPKSIFRCTNPECGCKLRTQKNSRRWNLKFYRH